MCIRDRIISGLRETFRKRYVVERTMKAEIRPEEQSWKVESCREKAGFSLPVLATLDQSLYIRTAKVGEVMVLRQMWANFVFFGQVVLPLLPWGGDSRLPVLMFQYLETGLDSTNLDPSVRFCLCLFLFFFIVLFLPYTPVFSPELCLL